MDIDDLRDLNSSSIEKLNATVEEIKRMMGDPDLGLDDEARLIARRATLNAEIDNQSMIRAHLKASQIVVQFTDAQVADLEALNKKMDKLIISGLKIEALLAVIPQLIDTSITIGNTITAHIGQGAAGMLAATKQSG